MNKIVKLIFDNIVSGKIEQKLGTEILSTLKQSSLKDHSEKDIAIIGMSLKFPMANSLDEFWENLTNGTDCVSEFPVSRQKNIEPFIQYTYKKDQNIQYCEAGYVDEIDKFDYSFFNISPKEASLMDPNQKLFMQSAWSAIEDGGYSEKKIRGSNTGVYIGYSGWPMYGQFISQIDESLFEMSIAGNISAIIASRIPHLLDLKGPSMLIDTACSSSLVALHLACQGIKNGECDQALVGGIRLNLLPIVGFISYGIESQDFRARSFDDGASGTSLSEGVATIFIKPVSKAIQDQDHIYAVIKGSATNQDGTSMAITAPNALAQADVIIKAWEDAKVDPETISFIETHGTGTKLGDPIEIEGIRKAFNKFTNKNQFCSIGSVKSNIGHLDSAAGIAGIIKMALALKHKSIPASLHFSKPNRNIRFEESPVYVNDRLLKWETEGNVRRGGVSSFGFSGTNCHVVMEEAPEIPTSYAMDEQNHILVISAKSEEALTNLVASYIKFMNGKMNSLLKDVCYTAGIGRQHYSHRCAIVAKDKSELLNKLKCFIRSSDEEKQFYYGVHKIVSNMGTKKNTGDIMSYEVIEQSTKAHSFISEFIVTGKKNQQLLSEICKLYIQGADIDWMQLYQGENRRKCSLPTYVFDRKTSWIEFPRTYEAGEKGEIDRTKEFKLLGRENHDFTETEKKVAEIWVDVLGYSEVSIFDNFFEIGGDSLKAAFFISRIQNEFNVEVTLSTLFDKPSIHELAGSLKNLNKINQIGLQPLLAGELIPLTPAQKSLFVHFQLNKESTANNMPVVLSIKGDLNIEKVEFVLNELMKRHESLRTSLVIVDGAPALKVHLNFLVNLQYISEAAGDISSQILSLVQQFDLHAAPLFRVSLIKLNSGNHLLVFDMHHIVSDGISSGILFDDFIRLYKGEHLSPLKFQYKEYAVWHAKYLQSPAMEKEREFWRRTLSGPLPALMLPTDFSRANVRNFAGEKLCIRAGDELSKKLYEIVQQSGTTLYMLLLAAYNILLARYTGQEDIIIGSPVAGRGTQDIEKVIGMFINILALRNFPLGNKPVSTFLTEVKENMLQAFENQQYPLEQIVEVLELRQKDTSRNILFDVMFVMQRKEEINIEFDGITISPYEFDQKSARFDLTLNVVEDQQDIIFNLEYSTSLFRKETAERLLHDYMKVLQAIVKDKTVSINQIELFNSGEKTNHADIEDFEFNF